MLFQKKQCLLNFIGKFVGRRLLKNPSDRNQSDGNERKLNEVVFSHSEAVGEKVLHPVKIKHKTFSTGKLIRYLWFGFDI